MAGACRGRRVLVEIPAPQPRMAAHIRRSYFDVLNSRVASPTSSSRNPVGSSPQNHAISGVKTPSVCQPGDQQADQVSLSQQQLVHLIRSLILRQRETAAASVGCDLKVLQEDLHLKKTNIYRSIPYSRLGSNRDAHCYRKAYPHLLAFKRSCLEGGRLLLQAQRWGIALEYAQVAWRYVGALPQWDTSSHNALREQCYGVLMDLCAAALRHHRPGAIQAQELLRRFKMAPTHSPLISPCIDELEKIVGEAQSSVADVTSPTAGQ